MQYRSKAHSDLASLVAGLNSQCYGGARRVLNAQWDSSEHLHQEAGVTTQQEGSERRDRLETPWEFGDPRCED